MEKAKEFCKDHKGLVVGAGVAAVALGASLYFLRGSSKSEHQSSVPLYFQWNYDAAFKKENISLYKTEAMKRSQLISNVKYDLFLAYGLKNEFKGRIILKFKLNSEDFEDGDLFLDFHGKAIAGVKINGDKVDCKFENHRIYFPKKHLKKGKNMVFLKFKNTYVTNSAGLHRFEDPEDHRVYLFSHLEPFFCHRIFPCFDQPDIKAPLTLTTHCPIGEWIAGGNGKFRERFDLVSEKGKDFFKMHHLDNLLMSDKGSFFIFDDSPLQSSYIYCFFAGEYHQFGNDDPEAPVPMSIFCRQSIKDVVPFREQFRVVKEGMKFFGEYFNLKYPFDKYDQIYCPQFRISAMENIGAITFSERLIQNEEERTSQQYTRHMYVVLHELSHMWFGDLVTMKWWEDLWLKESFADFMGAMCISKCPALVNFKNSE
jgi:aminopeptidase N